MSDKIYHIGGETGPIAEEDYQYTDEMTDEHTFIVRAGELLRARNAYAVRAEGRRRQAEVDEGISRKAAEHLEVMRRIAKERGIELPD